MLGRLAAATAALLVTTAAPATAADDAWDVPHSATITVDGHGHGHGRGLSQEGAANAAGQGLGYRDIVAFYYPGTSWGTAAGPMRVFLTKGDLKNAVLVQPRSGLVAAKVGGGRSWNLAKAKPRASAWRIVPDGDRASVLQYRQRGWHQLQRVTGQLEFSAQGKPVRLRRNDGTVAQYRGAIRSVPSSPGNRIAVNVLPMEAYLRGVVPAEAVASTFPQQALRAQAVAARSYAAAKRAARPDKLYDVDDTEASQVYLGYDREYPTSDQAVQATAREILTYDGAPALTEFTASNGGWTVAGDAPYLPAQPDPYDGDTWGPVTFADTEIEAAWPTIGDLTRIEAGGRDGHGEWGGRVGTVTLTGTAGTATMSGTAFAARLHLQSSWLTMSVR
ncbi:SpoIID/LytB domain-containing protein [Nocardioides aquiterrae]|uniref:Sporulation stage II protein D amidase enhancer LytB N-terminal domain-containing protein n=1 Tax=Nocardioides aquiterrae TaxID=203799 RepID=A0ABP4F3B1_9ACTN